MRSGQLKNPALIIHQVIVFSRIHLIIALMQKNPALIQQISVLHICYFIRNIALQQDKENNHHAKTCYPSYLHKIPFEDINLFF